MQKIKSKSDSHRAASNNEDRARKKLAQFKVDSLEPRILLSATWVDTDSGEALDAATSGDDTGIGDAADDHLNGLGGDDQLFGNGGDDFLVGDDGNDLLDGGSGDDRFGVYGSRHGLDAFHGGEGTDVIVGGWGNDYIRVSDGLSNLDSIEQIDGGGGHDTILGTSESDMLDFSSDIQIANVESIDAGAGDDHVIGTADDDYIVGNAGNDTLEGGVGNDRFGVSGSRHGLDTFRGGEGTDVIVGGWGNDYIRVSDGLSNLDSIEQIDGGGGHDTILGTSESDMLDFSSDIQIANVESIDAGAGDDHVIGTADDDYIVGNAGNDTLEGGVGNDRFGVSGSRHGLDTFRGGEGTDVIVGGWGNDYIRVSDGLSNLDSIEQIDGGGGHDTILGTSDSDMLDFSSDIQIANVESIDAGAGDDHVIGTADDDYIVGNAGNDTLEGGLGNDRFGVSGSRHGLDTFRGGEGTDVIVGGWGNDYIRVSDGLSNLDSIEQIDGGGGHDTILGTSESDMLDFSSDIQIANVESIDAGAGDDHVIGTADDDYIVGNAGNDTLEGGVGNDRFGVSGSRHGLDTFRGGEGTDVIVGGWGNDYIRVSDGLSNLDSIEQIDGGGGHDTILGTSESDMLDFSSDIQIANVESIDAGAGDDHVIGTADDDYIVGNAGNDTLEGGVGNDRFGVSGSRHGLDTFRGGEGTDVIVGGWGNDYIRVSDGLSNLDSIEQIDGGGGHDTILGTSESDMLDFSSGIQISDVERIDAGTGNDTVIGTSSNDYIVGNDGDDTLDGGAGNDVLVGGRGHDTVILSGSRADYEAVRNANGTFTVTDVTGQGGIDTLDEVEYVQLEDGTYSVDVLLNTAPEAEDLAIDMSEDSETVIRLRGTDGDQGGHIDQFSIDQLPEHGTLYLNGQTIGPGGTIGVSQVESGQLSFHPDRNFSGVTSFEYRSFDGQLWSTQPAKVTINVAGVADGAELGLRDSDWESGVSGQADQVIALPLAANLIDADGSETIAVVVGNIPVGTTISDGANSVVSDGTDVDVSHWDIERLQLTPVQTTEAEFELEIRATTREVDNGDTETIVRSLSVRVHDAGPVELQVSNEPEKDDVDPKDAHYRYPESRQPASDPELISPKRSVDVDHSERDHDTIGRTLRKSDELVERALSAEEATNSEMLLTAGDDLVVPGSRKLTDWKQIDFGEIREVRVSDSADKHEIATAPPSHRDLDMRSDYKVLAEGGTPNLAAKATNGLAWIWGLVRAYSATRDDHASQRIRSERDSS